MRPTLALAVGMALLALSIAPEARAQGRPILPSSRVFVVGPLSLYPQIGLRDVGTDSNVYNDPARERSDFRYSVIPRMFAIVPLGNTRFVGTGTGELVYFRTYEDQRSLTGLFDARYEVTSPGWRPFVSVGFVARGERVGFEIDSRARHTQTTMTAGTDVDLTAVSALTVWVGRSATAYEDDERYLSFMLADQLNHRRDTVSVGARFRVTPLTTVLIAAALEHDRFDRSPRRNADGFRVEPGVAFDSGASITGDAKGGFRSFGPLDPAVADYRGFVGSARLHYSLPDVIRLDFEANHDIAYSYDALQPYYLESGGRFTVTQRVVGALEAIGIVERREIRNQRIGGMSFDGRREVTTAFGGGVGIQLNTQLHVALTYEQTQRISTEPVGRNYERTRVLGSINYGL